MITLEKLAYEVRHTLKKLKVTDDVKDGVLYDKLSGYIELLKQAKYASTKIVNPAWIIDPGKILCANVNSGDDARVTNGSVVFAKYALPRLILFGDKPCLRVMNGLRTKQYTLISSFDLFYQIYSADREVLERNPAYVLAGNAIYAYPNKAGLYVTYAPADARDCLVKRALTPPVTGMPSYTNTQERMFTIWDELPVDGETARNAVLQVLTKDFAITLQQVEDNTQNGTDES